MPFAQSDGAVSTLAGCAHDGLRVESLLLSAFASDMDAYPPHDERALAVWLVAVRNLRAGPSTSTLLFESALAQPSQKQQNSSMGYRTKAASRYMSSATALQRGSAVIHSSRQGNPLLACTRAAGCTREARTAAQKLSRLVD